MADVEEVEVGLDSKIEEVKNWLKSEGYDKYKEARRLTEEEAKNDPESEPYKSKYAARDIWMELKEKLETFQSEDEECSEFTKLLLASVNYQLGLNYLETEEPGQGESSLQQCLTSLRKDDNIEVKSASLILHCLNQLGILWSQRGEEDKSLQFLQDGETLYHRFKKDVGGSPYSIHELFNADENSLSELDRENEFEAAFTHTLYYLAQVHGAIGDSKKSGTYCHTTLQRQLETRQYDPLDWSLNCATLSQYYITCDNYVMARHCLACSSVVLAEAQEKYTQDPVREDDSELDRQRKEKFPRTKADIARCWAKYCLNLIKEGKEMKEKGLDERRERENETEENNEEGETSNTERVEGWERQQEEDEENDDKENKNPLRFTSLEVTCYEQSVPHHVIKNFDEARAIFREGQKWLNQSKDYYILDGHVSDFVQIQQDLSQFYKLLAYFEKEKDRKCKMHKRRVDLLSEVLCELNPQHYLQICRQMMFEIAEAYSEMVDLKIAILAETEQQSPSVHAVKKINHLIHQAIKFFQTFIDSMKHKGTLPETFDEDIVRPALVSHFCIARLCSKFVGLETRAKLENLKKSVDLYNYIVNYCDSNPEMPKDAFEDELQISRDMAALLPIKMSKIMASST